MKNNNNEGLYLTDYNTNDKPWDTHKGESDDVGGIYATSAEFERYAVRIQSAVDAFILAGATTKKQVKRSLG